MLLEPVALAHFNILSLFLQWSQFFLEGFEDIAVIHLVSHFLASSDQ